MPLQVTKWIARVVGEHGHSATLPFDHRYNGREYKDRMRLSEVGRRVSWEIFVDFTRSMDPGEADYPHYARLEDEGDLVTLTEVRHIHTLAMSKVWDVAPPPDANSTEGPGSFRRHNIRPFPGGMQPPDWPDVPARMA